SWDTSHMRSAPLDFDSLHAALRAAGEGTRLRVLALLAEADLTVSDLTKILRQSQPRISRHLKLLAEAGLVDRFREGSWAFYRLGERGGVADIAQMLVGRLDPADPFVLRDRGRLAAVRATRAAAAQTYFSQHAAEWDRIRRLHVADAARTLRPQGRLLVVDFAPHDLEFLREEHAHLRLGFAPEAVDQWMKAAGLDVALHRTLPPEPGSDGKIAVSLWLARDPRLALGSSAQEVA